MYTNKQTRDARFTSNIDTLQAFYTIKAIGENVIQATALEILGIKNKNIMTHL